VIGEFAENEPKAAGVVDLREVFVDLFFAEDHLVVKHVGFEGGDAAEAPAGDGQGANEFVFENAGGLIVGLVGIEEGVEVFLGFAGEGLELGGQAVFEGVF
jgi:hypothetical protein